MVLDVQSLGLECLLGSGAVARYVSMAAVFPIILTWPLRSIEGMSRPRRLSQVMADHCSIFMGVSFSHGFQFLCQRVCPSDMTAK